MRVSDVKDVKIVDNKVIDSLDDEERAVLEWTLQDALERFDMAVPTKVSRTMPWRLRLRYAYRALKGKNPRCG